MWLALANGGSDQLARVGRRFQLCSALCCGWLGGIDFEQVVGFGLAAAV